MKIIDNKDNELIIKVECSNLEEKDRLVQFVERNESKLRVHKNGREHIIDIEDIYYIESVDKTTFVYTKNYSYSSILWLYQIEELLNDDFARINKSTIVNLIYLDSMKSDIGSRIHVSFSNGDKFVVTRSYSKEFKRKLGGN